MQIIHFGITEFVINAVLLNILNVGLGISFGRLELFGFVCDAGVLFLHTYACLCMPFGSDREDLQSTYLCFETACYGFSMAIYELGNFFGFSCMGDGSSGSWNIFVCFEEVSKR